MRSLLITTFLTFMLASSLAYSQIVNIDSSHGFIFDSGGSDPAPAPGQHINPIGAPVELTLLAGTYKITNAYGLPGADYSAWSYNVSTSSWGWAFVMADAATHNVILYGEAGRGSSAAQVAALPAVQAFSQSFKLTDTTTLLFTLRDYFVPDNAGGISLNVKPIAAVPLPATAWLFLTGLFAGLRLLTKRNTL
jgi:hypothetical protein